MQILSPSNRVKKWRIDNPEKYKLQCKLFRIRNREKLRLRLKEFRKNNPGKASEYRKRHFAKFPWRATFHSIVSRCKGQNPSGRKYYVPRGIKCQITMMELEYIWHRDRAFKMVKPSIDRKNSNGNYVFSNCRYIEHRENSGRSMRGKKKCNQQQGGK